MQSKIKRLLSMLMVFVLILGLIPSAAAATNDGTKDMTEPIVTEETPPPETTVPPDGTEPDDPTAPIEPTAPPETEPPATEGTEPDIDEEWDSLEPTPEDLERWAELASQLPKTIEADWPFDPSVRYPYGEPQENYYPGILLEDPWGFSPFADMSKIPDEMYDNAILRALAYTGYDVDWLRDNGYLYVAQYVSANINNTRPAILSDIGYDDYSPFLNGDETVADSSTVSGKAPDIAKFEANGMVCASFVTYYLCNYLPNIEGVNTTWIHDAVKATTANGSGYSTASVWAWETGLTNLANTPGSGVTKYTDEDTAYANLIPGDVIIFSRDGDLVHAAIYAGSYDMYNVSGTNRGEQHFIIHVGNSRGPEISTTGYMANGGSKASTPSAWYHIEYPEDVQATGFIEVYKKDPASSPLSGARFKAVHQETGDTFYIGPTNSSGYAKSGELPLGTYVVTETVFPTGYEASGQSSWTVTLTEDTPNMTITINAVNKKISGSLKIQKATNTGKNLSGWSFGVYTDAACSKPITGSPFTANSSGVITVTGLEPKTYYIKELSGSTDYWVTDNGVKTVTVTGGNTATVTVTNTHYGYGKIVKTTNTGGSLSGWKFNLYTDSACTKLVSGSPFTSGADGTIAVKLLPGTYYCREVDESDQYPDWTFDTATRTLTVTAGSTATVTFSNSQSGSAKVIKTATNGGRIEGWPFVLKNSSGTTLGRYVTDSAGIIAINLAPGTYTIQEQKPDFADSYWVCDTTPRAFTVKAGQTATVTFVNEWNGKAKIVKQATNGGRIEGWPFVVKDSSGNPIGRFFTDSKGTIALDLEPGTYTIQEEKQDFADEYWICDTEPRTITVKAGQTASVTFVNEWNGKAKIVKQATNGGRVDGWSFEIKNTAGTFTGVYTTNASGEINVELDPGTYEIREKKPDFADEYWILDTEPKTITVKAGQTAVVEFTNEWIGKARIIKTVEPAGAGSVEGKTFTIHRILESGTAISADYVATVTTGADGTILADLAPGKYLISEELAEDSLWQCVSGKSQEVTVTAGQTAEVSFINSYKPGKIEVLKVNHEGSSLAGAVFLLEWSTDEVSWQNVTYTESQYPIVGGCTTEGLQDGKLTVGKNGAVQFTGLHPDLYYRLSEVKAPDGYQLLADYAYEGKLPVDQELTVGLKVVNVPVFKIPETGSKSIWLMPVSLLLCLGTAAFFLFYRRKK